jgi:SAM-dependent methyltransferase
MALAELAALPRATDLVCPDDGSLLHRDEAGIACLRCGGEWECRDGVPIFAPPSPSSALRADPAPGDDEEPHADWRFLLPADAVRVLVVGSVAGSVTRALAEEAEQIAVVERDPDRARSIAGAKIVTVVSRPETIPFRDGKFDLAVLDGDVLAGTNGEQIARLRRIRRKLVPGGALFAPAANRFGALFPGRREHTAPRHAHHGLDGWAKIFRSAGFDAPRFHAAFPDADRPRELLPLDEPAALDWWLAKRSRIGRRLRGGIAARLVPHFAIVARARSGS